MSVSATSAPVLFAPAAAAAAPPALAQLRVASPSGELMTIELKPIPQAPTPEPVQRALARTVCPPDKISTSYIQVLSSPIARDGNIWQQLVRQAVLDANTARQNDKKQSS